MFRLPVNTYNQTFRRFHHCSLNPSRRWHRVKLQRLSLCPLSTPVVQWRGTQWHTAMSETLITGQTSEDLLADFETLLNSGSIDLGEDHQIVIITSPSNEGLNPAAAPTSTGEILLFATPQGPADVGIQDKRRPALGRPPVRQTVERKWKSDKRGG